LPPGRRRSICPATGEEGIMNVTAINRRRVLGALGSAGVLLTTGSCARGEPAANEAVPAARVAGARVVVIGGGFGGATAARYVKRLEPALEVTLVEPARRFYTCPFTNLYLGGLRGFEAQGHDYRDLESLGVTLAHEEAVDFDTDRRIVRLAAGQSLHYDRLVLSPGIDIRWNALEGYDEAAAEQLPHAWRAGPQTHLLKRQLEAMDDGGVFVLTAPENPFRCPPGPYERVSMVAHYLKTHKPNSKVLLLDAKDSFSKQALFQEGWRSEYGDMVEWVGLSGDGRVVRVEPDTRIVETEFGTRHRADVVNVVPPQKAAWIADRAGVTDASGWVPVRPDTFESALVPDVYVVGDATVAAPMPKSGFCANAQAKVAAIAIVASLSETPAPSATWVNTCYSLIAPGYGISVAGVYRVVDGAIAEVSGGVSPLGANRAFRRAEARNGVAWYNAICQDTWGTPPPALV
jgi:sulfide dehydrogenase [flavocytochrome c] flavoprotein chain